MRYDYKDLRRRLKAIDGGYAALAKRLGVSYQRVIVILGGDTQPKQTTMIRLNEKLKELESERDAARKQHSEIFLS